MADVQLRDIVPHVMQWCPRHTITPWLMLGNFGLLCDGARRLTYRSMFLTTACPSMLFWFTPVRCTHVLFQIKFTNDQSCNFTIAMSTNLLPMK
jgi:hypothetical protein